VHIEIRDGGCNAVDDPKEKQDVELFLAGALRSLSGSQNKKRSCCKKIPGKTLQQAVLEILGEKKKPMITLKIGHSAIGKGSPRTTRSVVPDLTKT
jgi:hypothetical protein